MGAHSVQNNKRSSYAAFVPGFNRILARLQEHELVVCGIELIVCLLAAVVLFVSVRSGIQRIIISVLAFLIGFFRIAFVSLGQMSHDHKLNAGVLCLIAALLLYLSGGTIVPLLIPIAFTVNRLLCMFYEQKRDAAAAALTSKIRTKAVILDNGEEKEQPTKTILVGAVLVVKKDEIVPLDGVIVEGTSSVQDTSATDSFRRRQVGAGDNVRAGDLNVSSTLYIRVTREFKDSSAPIILNLLNHADEYKSEFESVAIKADRYLLILVIPLAILVAVWFGVRGEAGNTICRACAAVLCLSLLSSHLQLLAQLYSHALTIMGEKGIVPLGKDVLDLAAQLSSAVFCRTGTVTDGLFKVTEVVPVQATRESAEYLASIAATIESLSEHPVARAICASFSPVELGGRKLELVEERAAKGIMAVIDHHEIVAGTAEYLLDHRIMFRASVKQGTQVYVALDGRYLGYLSLTEEIRSKAFETVDMLHSSGIKQIVMLTGAPENAAKKTALSLNFDMVKVSQDYDDKLRAISYLESTRLPGTTVMFVGDDTTDREVMKCCDVSVSFHPASFAEDNDWADILIIPDDISLVARFVKMAQMLRRLSVTVLLATAVCMLAMIVLALLVSPSFAILLAEVLYLALFLLVFRVIKL